MISEVDFMYCGTHKKALNSQKHLAEALYKLMDGKKFSDISVSEICREAGISRQTFYSLYESKENIIISYLQENIYSPREDGIEQEDFRLEEFCLRFGSYLSENKDTLVLLADNGILHLFTESMRRAMLSCDFFLTQLCEDERQYITSFIANGFTGIAQSYVERGMIDSDEYLKEKIKFLFSGKYIPD